LIVSHNFLAGIQPLVYQRKMPDQKGSKVFSTESAGTLPAMRARREKAFGKILSRVSSKLFSRSSAGLSARIEQQLRDKNFAQEFQLK